MSTVSVSRPLPLSLESLHARFQVILPCIELHGPIFLHHLQSPHRKPNALAEIVGLTWLWFVRRVRRGTVGHHIEREVHS